MSAALVLYFWVQERSLEQMSERPAFSVRLHSSVRMRLPSHPLLMQSWKGARMAPWASRPQPEKAVWSSGRTVDQMDGQEELRGRRLRAEVVVERRRRRDGRVEVYMVGVWGVCLEIRMSRR
jgi:hypothetical protein